MHPCFWFPFCCVLSGKGVGYKMPVMNEWLVALYYKAFILLARLQLFKLCTLDLLSMP